MSTRDGILAALERAGDFLSGEALARQLGISRAAVWKHITALKRLGYDIDGVRSRGYRLLAAPDRLDAESLAEAIAAGPTVKWRTSLVCKERTGSTNTDAMELGRRGAPEGTVVVADEQYAGRGRLGRSWESARGVNLYMSILLRPAIVPAQAPQLSLVAGVAVASAIEDEGLAPLIKWPNDVVVSSRKVAGILTEIEAEADRVDFVVVGVGVNLNSSSAQFPPAIRDIATSVSIETGRRVDRCAFAAALLAHFARCYRAFLDGGFASVAPQWERRSALAGRTVTVSGGGRQQTGVCVGIDRDGALLLKECMDGEHVGGSDAASLRRVLAGDVTVLGGYGRGDAIDG